MIQPARRVPTVLHRQRPLFHACLAPPFHNLLKPVPPAVSSVPSMMSEAEGQFCFNLAKDYYRGEGIILDAGILLGASTVCFGKGLELNNNLTTPSRPIVSIDRALSDRSFQRFASVHNISPIPEIGADFSSILQGYIAAVRERVDLRIGDIADVGSIDQPIEILYLDVLKETRAADFALSEYFHRLIPNRSIVIQQDYFVDTWSWIRERQEALASHFRYIGEIGPMAVFLCTKSITPEQARMANCLADPKIALRSLAAAEQRSTDPYRRLLCACSRVWRAAEMFGPDEATAALKGIRECYAPQIEALPYKRVRAALDAAEYVAQTEWSEDVADRAKSISAGLAQTEAAAESTLAEDTSAEALTFRKLVRQLGPDRASDLRAESSRSSWRQAFRMTINSLEKSGVSDVDRSPLSIAPADLLRQIQTGVMRHTWRGVMCNKDPFDIALYPRILWDLKPRTIIEIGTKFGGSALWLWDSCHLFDLDTRVLSVDVLDRVEFEHPGITFLQGDGRDLGPTLDSLMADLPRPMVVIEDADHHYLTTLATLRYFDKHLRAGEYIIVEDGVCSTMGPDNVAAWEGGPCAAIKAFLQESEGRYEIAREYCDAYGYNVTWNPNGYLRRTV